MVYFDHTATSPLDLEIIGRVAKEYPIYYANPSSIHAAGRKAKQQLETERKIIADLLEIDKKHLYFTSGGSEANNLVYLSFLNKQSRGEILISSCEHPSSYEPARMLSRNGYTVRQIPIDRNGIIDLKAFADMPGKKTKMISVIAVSNETGAIQPLKEIGQLLQQFENQSGTKIHFHSDFVQVPGKLIDKEIYGIPDSFSLSGHKFGAPRNCGLLFCKKEIQSLLSGGGQENNMRPGTEDLFGIMCLSRALEHAQKPDIPKVLELKNHFLKKIKHISRLRYLSGPFITQGDLYVPHIISIGFDGLKGEILVRVLSDMGFYCSAGSACSSRHRKVSPCFEAMGFSAREADSFIRISLHETHTINDIEQLANALEKLVNTYSL